MKSYKGRGIVLHTLKYGDKSLIVHLLTDAGGRQSFMVQGVRSTNGRGSKAGLFQPMFAVEFEGLSSAKMQMHRFREVHNGLILHSVPFDVRKSTIALFMAEVLYRLVKESEPNDPLFEFVWSSVEALDAIEEGISNFHLWFLSRLSRYLGFGPGNEYEQDDWFDIRNGAFVPVRPDHALCFSRSAAFFFGSFLRCSITDLARYELSRRDRVEVMEALLDYYGYHLDTIHTVQSIRILREVFDADR